MQINYNVTGAERKSLVGAISQELNAPTNYLGAPTFAYEVGGYHIDKNGILRGDDNPGLVADLQGLHDFKAITEEYDTPLPEAEQVPEDVQIPYEAALGGRVSPYCDYEEPPAYGEPEQGNALETNLLTIEIPRSTFTDMALENLKRLVESKSSLIQKLSVLIAALSLQAKILSVSLGFKESILQMMLKPTLILLLPFARWQKHSKESMLPKSKWKMRSTHFAASSSGLVSWALNTKRNAKFC